MSAQIFYLKRNDTDSELQVTLKDADGAAVDVTGATIVFTMFKKGRANPKVNKASVTLTNASSGIVTYSWVAADTNEAGEFLGEFQVTYAGSRIQTFPNREEDRLIVIIRKDLA